MDTLKNTTNILPSLIKRNKQSVKHDSDNNITLILGGLFSFVYLNYREVLFIQSPKNTIRNCLLKGILICQLNVGIRKSCHVFSGEGSTIITPPISHISDKVIILYFSSVAAKTYT